MSSFTLTDSRFAMKFPQFSRRQFLQCGAAAGIGSLSLRSQLQTAAWAGEMHPMLPAGPHFQPKAKHLIVLFLTGGFSHVDTFDPKPALLRDAGKFVEGASLRGVAQVPLLASPFEFTPRGESGLMISELFPHLGTMADDLCVIRSMNTDIVEHFQASLAMHTGSATVPLPSFGAWLSYGLGSDNPNLPPYVVFCEHLPYGGSQLWDSNFLPPVHQGTRVVPGKDPIPNLRPAIEDTTLRALEARMLDDLNNKYFGARSDDLALAARSQSFRTARGMMDIAPQVLDFSDETDETHSLYGLERGDRSSFAWQCLAARRLVEQGVRAIEIIDSGASNNWDAHDNMKAHRPKAERVDRPLTALIRDLKRRGLFHETLVAICTEFGRTPFDQGKGRNHWHRAFTCLLTGAGIRGGTAYGTTDEYGIDIVENPVHVHDYHATILHQFGIDHERLTYRYAGRDFRLTDVAGRVLKEILV
jgi:hypothetical protein